MNPRRRSGPEKPSSPRRTRPPGKPPRQRSRQPHAARAALILDPEARETEGRRIHAELGAQIEALIAERRALLDRAPYDPETTGADLDWERFKADWRENGRDGSYVKECNRVFREAGESYAEELDRRRLEIEALIAEQVEISHAYAHPHALAGYAALSPWIEAALPILWRRQVDAVNATLEEAMGPWDDRVDDASTRAQPVVRRQHAPRQHARLYARPPQASAGEPQDPSRGRHAR